jgi:hypothetical protein
VFGSRIILFKNGEPKIIPPIIKPTTEDEFSFLARKVNKKDTIRQMIKVMISGIAGS